MEMNVDVMANEKLKFKRTKETRKLVGWNRNQMKRTSAKFKWKITMIH